MSAYAPMNPYEAAYVPEEPVTDTAEYAKAVQVFAWRYEQLRAVGYDQTTARAIAESTVDLHVACDLVTNGCAPSLAAVILL